MRLAPSGRLHIGAGLIGIAAAGRRELRRDAAPHLKRLSLELHETVELVVLDGDEALFTGQYVPQRSLRVVAEVGDRFPLYCTACGKALLAELTPAEAERLIPDPIKPVTRHTNLDRRGLLKEIDVVRATGVAYDHQEHTLGVSAVGAAVHDPGGSMAAITVAMPAARLEGREERIAEALLRTRDDIQAAIKDG
jgi:DNA-binding IclR family transcriptional regulator